MSAEVIAGRYRMGPLLGRGGMAEVYAGTDLRLQRPVAIKLLQPEMAARPDIRLRFEAEARAAAGLSQPSAVAVYDTGEHEGVPYLVMERLPGETLADRIAAGPVDPRWMRAAARDVLAALAAAHAAGIVHRDVKPGNILIAADGRAKIADFGIAKSVRPGDGPDPRRDLTGTGQVLGTPAYLAPEQLEGTAASPRSDIYALGVVLYEALAGEKPFPGETPIATARAVALGQHRPLGELRPDLDPSLLAVVERAMSVDPGHRFASAREMAAALDGGSGAAGSPTVAVAPGGADATSVLDGTPMAAAPPAAGPPRRRGPRQAWAWALVAATVLGVLILLALADDESPSDVSAGAPDSSETTVTTAAATTTAPITTTAARSANAALADELRAAAEGLTEADGSQAPTLATQLEALADQVERGQGGGTATGLLITVVTFNQTGQLNDAATVELVGLLQRVPGVADVGLTPPSGDAPPSDQDAEDKNDKGKGQGQEDD